MSLHRSATRGGFIFLLVGTLAGLAAPANAAAPTSPSVFLNAKYADNPVRPGKFGANSGPAGGVSDYVRDIQWASWGDEQATGTGRVRLLEDRTSTSPVSVTLGGLKRCAGQPIYTTYSLEVAPGAVQPKHWPAGKTGAFPCRIVAGHFNNNDPGTRPGGAFGCVLFDGIGGQWMPKLPRGSAYSGLCAMRWTTWAKPTVTGKGVMRNGRTQWGVRAEVSGAAWCPKQAMSYTHLKMTLYGNGEAITGSGNIPKPDADRLRRSVGRKGLKKRVYRQTRPDCQT